MNDTISWIGIVSGTLSRMSSSCGMREYGQVFVSQLKAWRSEALAYAAAISVRLLSRNSANASRLYDLQQQILSKLIDMTRCHNTLCDLNDVDMSKIKLADSYFYLCRVSVNSVSLSMCCLSCMSRIVHCTFTSSRSAERMPHF